MSKAFTKEDVDDADRPRRTRTVAGLPPGAVNYLTVEGERLLRAEEAALANAADEPAQSRLAEIREILASATLVPLPENPPAHAVLGATVTVRAKDGSTATCRIVGAGEAALRPGWVSWQSPAGRALIGTEVGERVILEEGRPSVTVLRIDY